MRPLPKGTGNSNPGYGLPGGIHGPNQLQRHRPQSSRCAANTASGSVGTANLRRLADVRESWILRRLPDIGPLRQNVVVEGIELSVCER